MLSVIKFRFQYAVYILVWLLLSLPLLIFIFFRYRRYPEHKSRILERLSVSQKPHSSGSKLWVHLASVGEVKAALPLIAKISDNNPELELLYTTNTPAGEQVLKRALGEAIEHYFFPFDLPWTMSVFLKKNNIETLLLFETEIWPALIIECEKRSIAVLLVNARLSEESKKKYAKLLSFSTVVFKKITHVFSQTKDDSERFEAFGLKSVSTMGSLKFDQSITEKMEQEAASYKSKLVATRFRKIILAASVHPGEVKQIISSYLFLKKTFPESLMILAPRHLEKIDQIESILRSLGIEPKRKSTDKLPDKSLDVLIVDTIGELLMLYGCADVVIMGGTFIDRGGHNFLEPALWALPIVSGNSDYNFREIAQDLVSIGALVQVSNVEELNCEMKQLLENNTLAEQRGESAKNYVIQHRGATKRYLKALKPYLRRSNG